jgi:hypothetical protein
MSKNIILATLDSIQVPRRDLKAPVLRRLSNYYAMVM